jgi:transposase
MALLDVGWGIRQVAHQVKASPGSVCRWQDILTHQGEVGLTAKRHPGSKPKLTAEQCHHLLDLLRQGARAHGFRNELWPLRRIAAVIAQHCGITYCSSGVWRLLRRCQWSPQKPARRARARDDQAMA